MKYFRQLECPVFNLRSELDTMLREGKIHFRGDNQICLNSTKDNPDDYFLGNGSLRWDWAKRYWDDEQNKEVVPQRSSPGLREWHFDTLCSVFKGTEFERIYNYLEERYKIGRVRIMMNNPRVCMSWHTDSTARIHYPIKTQEGCIMVIEDEAMHIPADTLWWTETTNKHTAFNGSAEQRIHLVAAIID